ncbi:hypothetical protein IKG33_03270 [Candidatus Saccharibacteria bacterium]|nr:hypothetical protein [Candidatus Saccharibacteria bacterium]
MKIKERANGFWLFLASVLGLSLITTNVFAVPYDMSYSGGQELGNSTQINSGLVSGLTPLILTDNETVFNYSNSDRWEDGYLYNSAVGCTEVKYFRVSNSDNNSDKMSFTMSRNQYKADITFDDIQLDTFSEQDLSDKTFAVGVLPEKGYVFYGFRIYQEKLADETGCGGSAAVENINFASNPGDYNAFIKLKIKLYENNTAFTSNKLYFGITDIDAAQSYKILNNGNKLSSSNMYAFSAEALQPNPESTSLKNMFVSNGNYIYSQYDNDADPKFFDMHTDKNDVYVAINQETQNEGLDIVFGFTKLAWSGIQYYANQYVVNYESDDHGDITGLETENVISGNKPSGSSTSPDEGYLFNHWTADKDVLLANGTEIKKGESLTSAQVKQVIVNEDLTFTAIHVMEQYVVNYESDENGKVTGIETENVAPGNNPSGSKEEPNKGYKLSYWVADIDVILKDGTEIKAGEKITSEQIEQVVVTDDITFTAIHETEEEPEIPNTGSSMGELNAVQIAAPVVGFLLIALGIAVSAHLGHKKVNFD